MRILRVQGKNLASIAGEFELDFTAEPLRSAGIFVICGPTGSGKSTLLDAICLALFNNTPRTTGIEGARMADVGQETIQQGDRRQILRRGTTEAMAAVEFLAVDGKVYRSVWRVWRANNKVNGRLQPAELRVYGLPGNTPLTEGIGEAEHKLEQLTGLTYNQFTRTVLLAQNEFARFLKARREEKAEVLEKLTGTEIYSVISNTVYNRTAAIRNEWKSLNERMGNIRLLSPEEIHVLEKRIEELQQEEKQLQQKSENTVYKIRWYEQMERLSQARQEAEDALQTILKRQQEAAPRAELIARIESVEDSRKLWHEKTEAASQLSRQEQQFQTCEAALHDLRDSTAATEKLLQSRQELLQQHTAAYEALKPQILEARKLDIEIAQLKTQSEESRQTHSAANQALREEENLYQKRLERSVQLQEELSHHRKWFEKHHQHEQMCLNMGTIEGFLDTARQASLQATVLGKQIRQQEIRIEKTGPQLTVQTSRLEKLRRESDLLQQECKKLHDLLNATNITGIRQKREQLHRRRELLIQASGCLERLCQYRQETNLQEKALDEKQAALETYRLQWQQLTPQAEACRLRKDTAFRSLEKARLAVSADVRRLRSQLEENTPCPVCGSLHHPYAGNTSPADQVLQTLQQEAESYEKEWRQAEAEIIRLNTTRQHLQESLDQLKTEICKRHETRQEYEQQWKALCGELKIPAATSPENLHHLSGEVSEETEKISLLEKQWEQRNSCLRQAEEQAAQLRQQMEVLQTGIQQTQEELVLLRNTVSKNKSLLENLMQQQEDAFRKISGWLSLPDWKERWENDYDKFRQELKIAAEKWKTRQQQQEKAEKQYTQLRAGQEEQEKNLQQLRQRESEAAQNLHKHEAAFRLYTEKRQSLLQGKSVEETEQQWQQLLQAATDAIERTLGEKEKMTARLEQLKGQCTQLQEAIEQVRIRFNESSLRLQQWLTAYAERREAAISEEQLSLLLSTDPSFLQSEREALSRLRDQVTSARTSLQEREMQRNRHLQAEIHPDLKNEPLDLLRTTLSELRQTLEEINSQKAGILAELRTQQENHRETEELCRQLEEKNTLLEQWSKLDELIGSQSGYKFKEIAQSYTLDLLLAYANKQLAELTPRYQLQRIPHELGLQVIDHDLCDEVRSVFSLSGGESFLVSLALALGLSSFASRNHSEENLFIDEGFGTLDAETLQIVMEALERLRSQGRQIGIISHVQELAERIPVRICLVRTGNGKSKVKIEP